MFEFSRTHSRFQQHHIMESMVVITAVDLPLGTGNSKTRPRRSSWLSLKELRRSPLKHVHWRLLKAAIECGDGKR